MAKTITTGYLVSIFNSSFSAGHLKKRLAKPPSLYYSAKILQVLGKGNSVHNELNMRILNTPVRIFRGETSQWLACSSCLSVQVITELKIPFPLLVKVLATKVHHRNHLFLTVQTCCLWKNREVTSYLDYLYSELNRC